MTDSGVISDMVALPSRPLETALHVRVAEALGWSHIGPGNSMNMGDPGIGYPPSDPIVGHKVEIPRFDTDWSATGPLIEKYRATLNPAPPGGAWHRDSTYIPDDQWTRWDANAWPERLHGHGETPLIAICNLILALKESGKL